MSFDTVYTRDKHYIPSADYEWLFNTVGGPYLLVVTGPMAAGKSSYTLKLEEAAQKLGLTTGLFTHKFAEKSRGAAITSRSGKSMEAAALTSAREMLIPFHTIKPPDVIFIDEAQFFGQDLLDVVDKLLRMGKIIICTGVDHMSSGEPFGIMGDLLVKANRVEKLTAICTVCGDVAYKTYIPPHEYKKFDRDVIGDADTPTSVDKYFESRCFKCKLAGESVKRNPNHLFKSQLGK